MTVTCPHGDPTCPCPDGLACHYERYQDPDVDAMICPNPPLGFKGFVAPHCHVEGCDWHMTGCAGRESTFVGRCGLIDLTREDDDPTVIGSPDWACGALRSDRCIPS